MSYEYQVDIGGEMYGMGDIQAVNITQPLFDKLSVGNACSAELTISFWKRTEPPRMAKIIPYEREVGTEEWKQLGVFYIDTRSRRGELLSLVCYDTMLSAEVEWPEDDLTPFPVTMKDAADAIAKNMGTTVDERTVIKESEYIPSKPTSGTMRDILCDIASANGGNWIVTNLGELLLVPLFDSMPPETHYLIDEEGSAITFGGDRILI